eukprot:2057156-Amphidinium_carterae.1
MVPGRPVEPPKRIVKLINDTFHQYNSRTCCALSSKARNLVLLPLLCRHSWPVEPVFKASDVGVCVRAFCT